MLNIFTYIIYALADGNKIGVLTIRQVKIINLDYTVKFITMQFLTVNWYMKI